MLHSKDDITDACSVLSKIVNENLISISTREQSGYNSLTWKKTLLHRSEAQNTTLKGNMALKSRLWVLGWDDKGNTFSVIKISSFVEIAKANVANESNELYEKGCDHFPRWQTRKFIPVLILFCVNKGAI